MKEIDLPAGTHIDTACKLLISRANLGSEPVCFVFNGMKIIAKPGDDPSGLKTGWQQEMDKRQSEYRASPEYAKQQERQKEERLICQQIVDQLVNPANFPSTNYEWMEWVAEFTESADRIGVSFDKKILLDALGGYGWKINAFASDDPEIRKMIESDPIVMAEYIMGQVMDFLSNGFSPHPVAISFVEKYRKLAHQSRERLIDQAFGNIHIEHPEVTREQVAERQRIREQRKEADERKSSET